MHIFLNESKRPVKTGLFFINPMVLSFDTKGQKFEQT